MKKITLGASITTAKLPTIEVLVDNKVAGYLTPFRGYKFQISQTVDGDWDLSSSEVVGLGNLIAITESAASISENYCRTKSTIFASNLSYGNGGEIIKYLFKLMALEAIRKFSNSGTVGEGGGHFIESNLYSGSNSTLEVFIDACVEYIGQIYETKKES